MFQNTYLSEKTNLHLFTSIMPFLDLSRTYPKNNLHQKDKIEQFMQNLCFRVILNSWIDGNASGPLQPLYRFRNRKKG